MLINTDVFGPVEVDFRDIYDLPDGLLGFDQIHKYALISRQDDDITLQWFQAVETDVPCFVVFDPFEVVDGYRPELEKGDLAALHCSDPAELSYLVIAVVPEDVSRATVNLKSPIALNRRENLARQVILANKDYPIRFSLVEEPAMT